jgi:O-antigen biosynthesis protein
MANDKKMNFVLHHPADQSGCGHYRMKFPQMVLTSIAKDISIIDSMKLIPIPEFYRDINCVRIQRQLGAQQTDFILKFLVPLRNSTGSFTIVYEIDDWIYPGTTATDGIPLYNHARKAFTDLSLHENVKNIFKEVDFVTVTTPFLKDLYIEYYHVEPEKVIIIPNYMPRWWIGETYDIDKTMSFYNTHRKRPRIGLPLSSSHYDIDNLCGYDDTTAILPFILNNHKKYEFCFTGHCPKGLEGLAKNKKITILPGSDILNYPRELWRHNFQAVIAPLCDNNFNKAKSAIKLHECWSLGIPVIAQDLECYNKYTDLLFKDNNELQNQLDKVLSDPKKYKKIVKENRKVIDYGDNKYFPQGLWLEKNAQVYYNLYTQGQNTIRIDLRKVKKYADVLNKNKIEEINEPSGLNLEL